VELSRVSAMNEYSAPLTAAECEQLAERRRAYFKRAAIDAAIAIACLKRGTNQTIYVFSILEPACLLVMPDDSWKYNESLYNLEEWRFHDGHRERKAIWVRPKPEITSAYRQTHSAVHD
jgi:hypothetical protein